MLRRFFPVFLCTLSAFDRAAATDKPAVPARSLPDVVVVTGSYQPIPLQETERNVSVFSVRTLTLLSNTFADFLKLDPSVDMRQRSPNTIQSDVSIRGGTFGQTLVLLDGLRLSDVQSGHHNFDLPVPLESISQVEILKGSGSTLYGSDAVGGVVNFITRPPEFSEARVRAAAGNFGVNQQRVTLAHVASRVSQQLSASRDFSSGFRPNRDYRNLSLGSTTHVQSALGSTSLTLAHNDRPFGADQFYGNFNSWERTRTWFGSVRQTLGRKTDASFAFRRHTDLFVLYRDRPHVFTNRHAVESFQAAVRRHEELPSNSRLFYGIEAYRDQIVSNNLGEHDRARGAAYVAYDIRALSRFSLSAGLRDEVYGSGQHQLSPTLGVGAWVAPKLKLRASLSRAFRLPTYTDLYYHDPANIGSPDLRPERAWSYEAGIDWNASGRLRASGTVFQRQERDGIDYVRNSPAGVWRATNFQSLRFTGVEAMLSARLRSSQSFDLGYTGLAGAQIALDGVQSKYVFNYPQHSAIAAWSATLPGRVLVRTRLGVVQRFEREAYGVWDVYLARSSHRLRPFFQLTNMTGTRFEEVPGVPMPGRGIVGGLELIAWGAP